MDEIELVRRQFGGGNVEATNVEVARLDLVQEPRVQVDGHDPARAGDPGARPAGDRARSRPHLQA